MEHRTSHLSLARVVNLLEDLKLKRSLTLLDLHRSHLKKTINNEIFEQKRIAFKFKCEVRNIKKNKNENVKKTEENKSRRKQKKTMKKFDSFISLCESSGICSNEPEKELVDINNIAPGKIVDLPKIVTELKSGLIQTALLADDLKNLPDHDVKLPPIEKTTTTSNDKELDTKDNLDGTEEKDDGSNLDTNAKEKTGLLEVRKKGTIDRLFPDILTPRFKTRRTNDEGQMDRKPLLENSHRMIPVKDYWIGDPIAIGSVRRPRKNIAEMTSRNKSMGPVQKLIREIPFGCSKNCDNPSSKLESQVSSQAILVPATKFAAQRKAFEMLKRSERSVSLEKMSDDATKNSEGIETEKTPEDITTNKQQKPISGFDLKYFTSIFRKNALQKVAKRRLDLNKKNKEMQKRLQVVRQRSSVKAAENFVVDVNKTTRVQVGYTFDPLEPVTEQTDQE